VDSSLLFGIDTFGDHKRAFMNCTREVLFKDLITLLPPGQTVAEILESVEPEDRVIAACKRLRAAGYRIALDDFAPDDPRIRWSSLPTSSKSTFAHRPEERVGMMRRFGSRRARCWRKK